MCCRIPLVHVNIPKPQYRPFATVGNKRDKTCILCKSLIHRSNFLSNEQWRRWMSVRPYFMRVTSKHTTCQSIDALYGSDRHLSFYWHETGLVKHNHFLLHTLCVCVGINIYVCMCVWYRTHICATTTRARSLKMLRWHSNSEAHTVAKSSPCSRSWAPSIWL